MSIDEMANARSAAHKKNGHLGRSPARHGSEVSFCPSGPPATVLQSNSKQSPCGVADDQRAPHRTLLLKFAIFASRWSCPSFVRRQVQRDNPCRKQLQAGSVSSLRSQLVCCILSSTHLRQSSFLHMAVAVFQGLQLHDQ